MTLAAALIRLWPEAREVFAPLEGEAVLVREKLLPTPMAELHDAWQAKARHAVEPITGELPAASPSPDGRTRRTDDFAWLHGEFTSVARQDAVATW